jgi:coatomer subunit epsilon
MLNVIYMTLRGALLIQLYIRIDRLDLAEKHLKVMKSADEDSTLSMLASAWIGLSSVSARLFIAAFSYICPPFSSIVALILSCLEWIM